MKLRKCPKFLAMGLVVFILSGQSTYANEKSLNATDIADNYSETEGTMPDGAEDEQLQENQSSEELSEDSTTEDIDIEDNSQNNEGDVSLADLSSSYKIRYRVHVQTYGWLDWVYGDEIAGTEGKAKRMEAIQIQVVDKDGNPTDKVHVEYRVHAQSYGWLDWVSDGETAGTIGKAKRLEAIQIHLKGSDGTQCKVKYKTHVQSYGWMDTVDSDEVAGTEGKAKRMEAIIISLEDAIEQPVDPGNGDIPSANTKATITYSGHVQTYGDVSEVKNGAVLGTVGQAKRIEGIKINLIQPSSENLGGDIVYSAHVQTYGWSNEVSQGTYCGTTGESKRLEAVKINLSGELADKYDIYYRVHSQSYGWLGWASNGEPAGTEGYAKRLEAIQIQLVENGGEAPDTSGNAFVKKGSTVDNGNTDLTLAEKVQKIRTYINTPYVWGGSTPEGWDCSGCVQWICKNIFGVSVSRVTYDQAKDGIPINISDSSAWQVGDILCFAGTDGISHTGLYIGNGEMIHAVSPGYGTMIQNVKLYETWDNTLKLVAVRRVL